MKLVLLHTRAFEKRVKKYSPQAYTEIAFTGAIKVEATTILKELRDPCSTITVSSCYNMDEDPKIAPRCALSPNSHNGDSIERVKKTTPDEREIPAIPSLNARSSVRRLARQC